MSANYEWSVETQTAVESEAHEVGEVLDVSHFSSYAEAADFAAGSCDEGCLYEVVLVRDSDAGRSWAYMEDGELPSHFVDAFACTTAKVPQRYAQEVARHRGVAP